MLQPNVIPFAVSITEVKEIAPRECCYLAAREIDSANNVRFTISNEETLAIARKSGRLCEACFQKRAILASLAFGSKVRVTNPRTDFTKAYGQSRR